MLRVEMTDDIRKYETKFMGPFTARQTACIGIALILAVPLMLFLPIEDLGYKLMTTCIVIAPIVMCGWISIDGTYLEVLAIRILYFFFLAPPKRKNKSRNTYREYFDYLRDQEEKKYINSLNKKERKKYEAKKKAKKTVKYYNDKQYKIYT